MTSNTLRVDNCSHCTTPSERNDHQLVPVKVGCLHINPATPRGRRVFMVQMLVLCFVPHAALVAQNCSAMAQLSQTLDTSLYLHNEVGSTLCLGEAVAAIQEERLVIAKLLIFESEPNIDRLVFDRVFEATDSRLKEMSVSLQDHQASALYVEGCGMRHHALLHGLQFERAVTAHIDVEDDDNDDEPAPSTSGETAPAASSAPAPPAAEQPPSDDSEHEVAFEVTRDFHRRCRWQTGTWSPLNQGSLNKIQQLSRITVYGEINSVLLLYLTKQVKSTTSSLWRQLSACYELLKGVEELSFALLSISHSEDHHRFTGNFQQHHSSALEHLSAALLYLKAEKVEGLTVLDEVFGFYKGLPPWYNDSVTNSLVSYYQSESLVSLEKLRQVQATLWDITRESVKNEVWVARRTLAIGVAILTTVLLASPVLVLLIRYTVNTIQVFNQSVEVSTQQLMVEKQKSDMLLSRMLPAPVLRRLRADRAVPAEAFDAVTIFFSDIVGFTTISANSTPMEVINMLNMLYRLFDEKIMQYNVYKVETIGDAYMVVSGLPQRNGHRHASEIADMSLSLMRSLEGAKVPHRPDEALKIRAGVNTGPCVAGVVGTTMPRYCLFGDTINVASRMESTGEAMKIHISYSTKKALDMIGGYEVQSRGVVDIAGKGQMETYWLLGKVGGLQMESPRCLRFGDFDSNLLELLIKA